MKSRIQKASFIILGISLISLAFIVLFAYGFDPNNKSYVKVAWAMVAAGFAVLGTKITLDPSLGNLTKLFGNYAWSYVMVLNAISIIALISAFFQL